MKFIFLFFVWAVFVDLRLLKALNIQCIYFLSYYFCRFWDIVKQIIKRNPIKIIDNRAKGHIF